MSACPGPLSKVSQDDTWILADASWTTNRSYTLQFPRGKTPASEECWTYKIQMILPAGFKADDFRSHRIEMYANAEFLLSQVEDAKITYWQGPEINMRDERGYVNCTVTLYLLG